MGYVQRRILQISHWLQDAMFRQLIGSSGWLLGGTAGAAVISLLSMVLRTRSLGLEGFGLLSLVLAYLTVATKISSFLSWKPLIKFGTDALSRNDGPRFVAYVRLALFSDMVGAVLGSIGAAALSLLYGRLTGTEVPHLTSMLLFVSFSRLFLLTDAPTGVLRILGRFRLFTVQKLVGAFTGLIGTVIVYVCEGGIWGFLVVSVGALILESVMLFFLAHFAMKPYTTETGGKLSGGERRGFLRFMGWGYSTSLVNLPVQQMDVLLVSMFLSLADTGIYRVIKQALQMISLLTDPVYQVLYPQFASMMAKKDGRGARQYARRTGILIGLIALPAGVIGALFSPLVLRIFFSSGGEYAWMVLAVFLVVKAAETPFLPLHPLFTAAGFVGQATWILLAANILYLTLVYSLVGSIGLWAFVFAWAMQVVVAILPKYWILQKVSV